MGPKEIHRETMCCGYARCSEIVIFDDGGIILTDDNFEEGSVGTIKLRPEQVERLRELLGKK